MKKIFVDCDPGHDDALALMLAAGHPEVEVVGISVTHGNTTLKNASKNARGVAGLVGLSNVPIAEGASRPLLGQPLTGSGIHGSTGLDGPELFHSGKEVEPKSAVNLLLDIVEAAGEQEVTIVATGPLTNLALAVRVAPHIVDRVREVIIMGGSLTVGNRTPVAEFNILSDPEAARMVFEAGWKLTMVGLDTTHRVLATADRQRHLRRIGSPVSSFAADLLEYVTATYKKYPGVEGVFMFPPVHDVCAMALAIDSSIFSVRRVPIAVETDGRLTRGMTVADFRGDAPESCRTFASTDVESDDLWEMFINSVINS